jgi:uncharacterized membrane protein YfcA
MIAHATPIALFLAGLLGGVMNSAAGGGIFVAFPVLLFLGVPSIQANATATIAIFPGTVATMLGYRQELLAQTNRLPRVAILSFIGGTIGSVLLLRMSNASFSGCVPYLLLLATIMFTASPAILKWIRHHPITGHRDIVFQTMLWTIFVLICVYGGFFGAGMGIMVLGLFGVMGMTKMHQMNSLRSFTGFCSNVVAILLFTVAGIVQWRYALIMGSGAILGGYTSGIYFRRMSSGWMRNVILLVAWGLTIYFFFMSN